MSKGCPLLLLLGLCLCPLDGARAQRDPFASLCWGAQDAARTVSISEEVEDASAHGEYYWTDDDCSVKVRYRGPLTLSADGRRILRLGRGGRLTVEERRGRSYRRLEVWPDAQGRPRYEWDAEGTRQIEPGGDDPSTRERSEDWLARFLPDLTRRSGLLDPGPRTTDN